MYLSPVAIKAIQKLPVFNIVKVEIKKKGQANREPAWHSLAQANGEPFENLSARTPPMTDEVIPKNITIGPNIDENWLRY